MRIAPFGSFGLGLVIDFFVFWIETEELVSRLSVSELLASKYVNESLGIHAGGLAASACVDGLVFELEFLPNACEIAVLMR